MAPLVAAMALLLAAAAQRNLAAALVVLMAVRQEVHCREVMVVRQVVQLLEVA